MLTLAQYEGYRREVMGTEGGPVQVEWARAICRPTDADSLADTLVRVILSSGFSADTADAFFPQVSLALREESPVCHVFCHPYKPAAMEHV